MAIINVATAAAANTAIASATSGDTIRFLDSGTFTGADITVGVAGLTLIGETPRTNGPRRVVVNANNTTIADLRIQCDQVRVTGSPSRTQALVFSGSAGNANGIIVDNCLIRAGDSLNGFVDFDPTDDTYPEYGPIGGSAIYNNVLNEARGLELNRHRGSFQIVNCTFTGLSDAVKFSLDNVAASVSGIIRGNIFDTVYQDAISIGVAPQVLVTDQCVIELMQIEENIFKDLFAVPQDNNNPHGDAIQLFAADSDANPTLFTKNPWRGVVIRRNIGFQSPGARGYPQFAFLSDIPPGFPFVKPVIEDNIVFQRIDKCGANINNDGKTGVFSGRVRRNIFLANPRYNVPTTRESTTNTTSGIPGISRATPRSIWLVPDPANLSTSLVVNNVAEAITQAITNDTQGRQNTILGLGDADGDYDSIFTTRPNWDTLNSAQGVIDACKLIRPELAARNPVASGSTTVADFFAQPDLPEPKWIGFAPGLNAEFSTVTASAWSACHGDINIESVTNCEYRTADDFAGTVNVSAWTTAPALVPTSKFIQLRATSAATQLKTVFATVTHDGGQEKVWTLTTKSTTEFPQVIFNTTGRYRAASSGIAPNSTRGTIGLRVFRATAPAANERVIATSATSGWIFTAFFVNTGQLRLSMFDASNVERFRWTTPTSITGTYTEILLGWDTLVPLDESGFLSYINGSPGPLPTTWTPGFETQWNRASHDFTIGGAGATGSVNPFSGQLDYFWCQPGEMLDLADLDVRSRFNAARILPDGSGPFNEARQPVFFVTGRSGSTYANYGSGPAFALNGTALSMANAANWPAAVNQYGPIEITVTDAASATAGTVPQYLTVDNP